MPRDLASTPECFQSHLGVWAILPSYLHESLAAIRSGLYRPRAQGAPVLAGAALPADVQGEGVMPPPLSYVVTAEGVGVLPLHGPSMKARSKYGGYSTVDARRQLRAMAADERVGAILLHIDSPGGHVAGTKELADDVAAVDQTKPVHAYIEDAGASAAYWVASQARTIAANAMAMVGSLGTFTVLYDLSKAAEMEGVQVHVVSTGERKGAAAPGTPVTDEDVAEAQRLVDGFDAFFRAARPRRARARGEGGLRRVDRARSGWPGRRRAWGSWTGSRRSTRRSSGSRRRCGRRRRSRGSRRRCAPRFVAGATSRSRPPDPARTQSTGARRQTDQRSATAAGQPTVRAPSPMDDLGPGHAILAVGGLPRSFAESRCPSPRGSWDAAASGDPEAESVPRAHSGGSTRCARRGIRGLPQMRRHSAGPAPAAIASRYFAQAYCERFGRAPTRTPFHVGPSLAASCRIQCFRLIRA